MSGLSGKIRLLLSGEQILRGFFEPTQTDTLFKGCFVMCRLVQPGPYIPINLQRNLLIVHIQFVCGRINSDRAEIYTWSTYMGRMKRIDNFTAISRPELSLEVIMRFYTLKKN